MDFDDAGEEVYSATTPTNNTTATFTVPASATVGSHRMRIGAGTVASLTPCFTGSAAAFEDYTLYVDTLGPVHLSDAACNSTVSKFTDGIYTSNFSGGQQYKFRVKNGNSEEILVRNTSYFTLNMLAAPAYGVTYLVDVAVMVNSVWTDYGKVCTITASSPLSRLERCEQGSNHVESFAKAIYAVNVPLATSYRFMITSTAGSTIIDRPQRFFSLNMLSIYDYNVNYTVRVAVLAGGVWSDYGDACTVRVEAPTVSLRAPYCGGTVTKRGTAIYADNYPGAITYHFRVTVGANQYVVVRNAGYFFLSQLPVQIPFGTTVGVEVKVFTTGTESAYGAVCQVTLSNTVGRPGADVSDIVIKTPLVNLSGFPNPFNDTFSVDFVTESEEMVGIVVYDMTGKLVDRRSVSVNELPSLKIGDHFAAGVYNLILTQGETIKTLRVVKSVN